MLSETIINNMERKRASRIARGNLSILRGRIVTQLEWEKKKKQFPHALKRVLKFLGSGEKSGKS